MVRIRILDERMMTLQRQGRIGFYGACTGQEAACIGSAYALRPTDWIFPALREAAAMLLRGFPLVPPAIQGVGNAGGFALQVEQRDGSFDYFKLQNATDNLIRNASSQSALSNLVTSFRAGAPQLDDLDHFRNHFPALLNEHPVADAHIQPLDLVLVSAEAVEHLLGALVLPDDDRGQRPAALGVPGAPPALAGRDQSLPVRAPLEGGDAGREDGCARELPRAAGGDIGDVDVGGVFAVYEEGNARASRRPACGGWP
jgi:hypothetical protein